VIPPNNRGHIHISLWFWLQPRPYPSCNII